MLTAPARRADQITVIACSLTLHYLSCRCRTCGSRRKTLTAASLICHRSSGAGWLGAAFPQRFGALGNSVHDASRCCAKWGPDINLEGCTSTFSLLHPRTFCWKGLSFKVFLSGRLSRTYIHAAPCIIVIHSLSHPRLPQCLSPTLV